jgi:hypothetical protein
LGPVRAGGTRFARKIGIVDAALCRPYWKRNEDRLPRTLGGSVIKERRRTARAGQGKSGSFRTLIIWRAGVRAFFVHGFAGNERDNIARDELDALKKLASELLAYDDQMIGRAVGSGTLRVTCHEETIS